MDDKLVMHRIGCSAGCENNKMGYRYRGCQCYRGRLIRDRRHHIGLVGKLVVTEMPYLLECGG